MLEGSLLTLPVEDTIVKKTEHFAALTTALLVILGVIQIIMGATISKSVALTANGIDCIGDGFVSGIVWIGLRFFRKPADHKFHFGYFKIENLASMAASVVMFILAGYIIFRSYNQLVNPHPVELPLIGAEMALLAAALALGLGFYKYRMSRRYLLKSAKLEAFNTVKDGIASFLTVVALLAASQGFIVADAIVGFIIAGIIMTIGFAAIKESSYMLVDACDTECIQRGQSLRDIAEGVEGVHKAHMVRLRRSGPVLQGEIEIQVEGEMTVRELEMLRGKLFQVIQEQYPEIERLIVTAKPFDNS